MIARSVLADIISEHTTEEMAEKHFNETLKRTKITSLTLLEQELTLAIAHNVTISILNSIQTELLKYKL